MRFRLATNGAGGGQELAGGVGNLFRSIAMAPAMAAQASQEAMDAQAQRELRGAQTRSADAQSLLYGQQALDLVEQRERGSLGSVLRNAAMINKVDPRQVPDVVSYLQTGQMPGQYTPAPDGMGPVLPTPAVFNDGTVQQVGRTAGLSNQALAQGDNNVENLFKALGLQRNMDLGDDVLAGRRTAASVGQAQAAMDGDRLVNAIGTTGMGYNLFTGEGQQLDPGLRAIFGDESVAKIDAERARAGASRASAASSYATAAKTIQERMEGLGRGGQKAPAGYRWTADGSLEVIPGGPADTRNKTGAPTEDERKAAGWVTQAQFAFDNMEEVLKKSPGAAKPGVLPSVVGAIPGVGQSISNSLKSEARQQFEQAAESFAEAALRAATGAGVNRDEAIQKVRELTPQIGDKPGNIRQKREALSVYLESLRLRAGRALPDGGGVPRPGPGGATGSWGEPAGGGWSIQRVE